MSKYSIDGSTLTSLADSIRNLRHETDDLSPAQMIAKIQASRLGIPIEVSLHINGDGEWERPDSWPDLDSIIIGDSDDVVYLTYDLDKTPDYGWIGLRVTTSGGNVYIDRGHLTDGVFVADEPHTVSANANFTQTLDSADGTIQLWRVTADNPMLAVHFITNSATQADNFRNEMQPCVERVGRLSYLKDKALLCYKSDSLRQTGYTWGTVWLEHDAVTDVGKNGSVTSMQYCWANCFSLQSLDVSGWDVSNWALTSLAAAWYNCQSLRALDLSGWDTSGWRITNISSAWYGCHSLRALDLSSWDTSNWAVTSLNATWFGCYSLQSLEVSDWDTSGWAVTTLGSAWYNCSSLTSFDPGNWNTQNWTVTTLNAAWYGCMSLRSLDLSNWDTSNWSVTSIYSAWYCCYSLQSLDVSGWDTSGWAVTTFAYMFYQCVSLQAIDLSSWDTSHWAVTSMASAWYGCNSLRSLDLSDWDVSNWVVTSLASVWCSCYSLQDIDVSGWDTSNWAVTSLDSMFSACYSLQSLDLSDWNTSNWSVTTMYYAFNNCRSLSILDLTAFDTSNWKVTNITRTLANLIGIRLIDISTWDISGWSITAGSYLFENTNATIIRLPADFNVGTTNRNASSIPNAATRLEEFTGLSIDINHTYANSWKLNVASLVAILDKLPTVTAVRTITLGQINKNKLTAEQIAVATEKGWTVA